MNESAIIRRLRRQSLADAERLKLEALNLLDTENVAEAKTTALDCLIMVRDAERLAARLREVA